RHIIFLLKIQAKQPQRARAAPREGGRPQLALLRERRRRPLERDRSLARRQLPAPRDRALGLSPRRAHAPPVLADQARPRALAPKYWNETRQQPDTQQRLQALRLLGRNDASHAGGATAA